VDLSGGLYYSKHSHTIKKSIKMVGTNRGLIVRFQSYARLTIMFKGKNNYRLGAKWKIGYNAI